MKSIKYISKSEIKDKKVLLRVDFNVSINSKHKIADDQRIRQSLPTIEKLRKENRLILVAHLDRPKGRDEKYSLKIVEKKLQEYLPKVKVDLVDDFQSDKGKKQLESQKKGEILVLENIRFYEGEEENDKKFSEELAALADVYVNDAFGVAHRRSASVVGVAEFLPSYCGLLLEKEIEIIGSILKKPKKPFVAIIGGAKVSTKFALLNRLTEIADTLILGGGIANTFLDAQGLSVGKSLYEKGMEKELEKILKTAKKHDTKILLPQDAAVGDKDNEEEGSEVKKVEDIKKNDVILDIGPEAMADYAKELMSASTIIWNGPVGYIENNQFNRGTDFLYYIIAENENAKSIVGGGDTIAAISKKEYLDKITHISTGGGAMLEFIEKGTLPGIEALKR